MELANIGRSVAILAKLVQLYIIKTQCKYIVLERGTSYCVKYHIESSKKFSENVIFQSTRFLSMDMLFNRQSPFIWIPAVLPISSTCFFNRTRQTSFRGLSRKANRNLSDPLISRSAI